MNVAKVEIHWQLDGTLDIFSILHVKSVDSHVPYTEAHLEQIALGVDAWWHGGSQPPFKFGSSLYTPQVVLYDVTVTRILPTESDPYILPVGVAGIFQPIQVPGTNPEGLPWPPQVCWLIGLRTAVDTRRGRGRVYLPSRFARGPLDNVDTFRAMAARGQVWDEDLADLGKTAATLHAELFEAGASGEFVWCVYSEVAGESYAVTHFEVANFLRTQRRRAFRPSPHTAYGLSGDPA
jgi:hypothetical protein